MTTYADIEAEICLSGSRPSIYFITATRFIEVLQNAYSFRRAALAGFIPPEFEWKRCRT